MRFVRVVSKAVTRTDHRSGLCTSVSTLAPSQACMTPSYFDFQSLFCGYSGCQDYTQLWLVRMGSFCSIWVQQNRYSQNFLSTKLTRYCSFKQKANVFLFLSVLVHFSRLLASSVPHLAYISQREHREFTIFLFLRSQNPYCSASLSFLYLLIYFFMFIYYVPTCTLVCMFTAVGSFPSLRGVPDQTQSLRLAQCSAPLPAKHPCQPLP